MANFAIIRMVYAMFMQPYSGSLLRLAVTTVAVIALLATAFVWWQSAQASYRSGSRPAMLGTTRP
jgi:hypothetical protein